MTHRVFILPLWIRLWHWTNATLIIILSISGASLHFANLNLHLMGFETAIKVHNFCGLSLLGLYFLFIIANMISGNWWQYVPKPQGFFERVWTQMKFYAYGIFRGAPHPYPPTPESNFNSLQQVIYWAIMYFFFPLLLISGVMFLWPDLAPRQVLGYDGLLPVAILHYIVGLVIVCFTILHIYLGTTGHSVTSLFKMMITGWHEGD